MVRFRNSVHWLWLHKASLILGYHGVAFMPTDLSHLQYSRSKAAPIELCWTKLHVNTKGVVCESHWEVKVNKGGRTGSIFPPSQIIRKLPQFKSKIKESVYERQDVLDGASLHCHSDPWVKRPGPLQKQQPSVGVLKGCSFTQQVLLVPS